MSYDLVVIGAGPGGYVCAIRAAQLGLKVAVVEKRSDLRRHLPQRRLHPVQGAAARLRAIRRGRPRVRQHRHRGRRAELDLAAMMKHKDEGVDGNVNGVAFLFKKNKIDCLIRRGRIAGARQGRSDGRGRRDAARSTTKNIVIATGSDVAPAAGRRHRREDGSCPRPARWSSTEVPKQLLVVGAGVIGLELGSVWRRLGAEVTVVEFLDRILPGMDGEVARQFQRILEKQGIEFQALDQGDRRRSIGQAPRGERRAGRRRRRRDARRRRRAGRDRPACPTPKGSASRRRRRTRRARPHRVDRSFRTNVARHLRHRRRGRAGRCWPTRPRKKASPSPRSSPARPAM